MEPTQKQVSQARTLLQEYQKIDKESQTIYWSKAEAIYWLKKNELWKLAVGESGGTWGSFCAESLKCPQLTADRRASNYEFYVIDHKFKDEELAEYDAYNLYYIALYSKDKRKDQILEKMEDSKVIGRADLVRELKGDDTCEHEHTHEEEEQLVICEDCKRVIAKKKK